MEDKIICINEGDFGNNLQINITKEDLEKNDTIQINIFDKEKILVAKTYTVSETGKIEILFALTEEETKKLLKGFYNYSILHLREGKLRCTAIKENTFEVH